MKLKKDDIVEVITGKYKGQKGRIIKVLLDKNRVIVEGCCELRTVEINDLTAEAAKCEHLINFLGSACELRRCEHFYCLGE